MRKFSNAEYNVLQKYVNWCTVSEEDAVILARYASIGFVQSGFDWDKMEEMAKLTKLGRCHL